jgi:hypothetical protein
VFGTSLSRLGSNLLATLRAETEAQMTTQPIDTGRDRPLRTALVANAIFSATTGTLMLAATRPVSDFLGLPYPWIAAALGLGLLGFAVQVALSARRTEIGRQKVHRVIGADVAWVLASGLLLVSGLVSFTTAAKWAVLVVADIVAAFAFFQWLGLRKLTG